MPETPAPSPLRQHLDSAMSSFAHLWRRPLAAVLSISVMALALGLPLGLWLALHNLEALPAALERARTIDVFLKPEIDAERAQALAAQLRDLGVVAEVEHLRPEEGLAELRAQGLGDVATLISADNPLPHLLRVMPLESEDELVEMIAQMPEVEWLQHDAHWQQQVGGWLHLGHRLVWGLGLIFGIGAVLVVGNTVRLDLQSRTEEMRVLQLIGADPGFIRRPYVYLGLWSGLLSGALALAVLAGALVWLAAPLAALLGGHDGRPFSIQGFALTQVLLVLVGSALLGAIGACWVSGRVLLRSEVR